MEDRSELAPSDAAAGIREASGGDTSGDDATAEKYDFDSNSIRRINGAENGEDLAATKPQDFPRTADRLSVNPSRAENRPRNNRNRTLNSSIAPSRDFAMAGLSNNVSRSQNPRGQSTRSTQPPQGRAPHPQLQSLPDRPQFSLAGSSRPVAHEPAFIDPEYYSYNPNYEKPKQKPLWGLAKPLPRVVRPGMRPGEDRKDRKGKDDGTTAVQTHDHEPGTQPIPEIEKIASQRQWGHRDSKAAQRVGSRQSQARTWSRQSAGERKPSTTPLPAQAAATTPSSNVGSMFDKYGTPRDEKEDPMEKWTSTKSAEKHRASEASQDKDAARKMYDDHEGDAGTTPLSRLSSVKEIPSPRYSAEGSALADGDAEDYEPDPRDLEAGSGEKLNMGWVDDDTAVDQYEDAEAEHVYNHWGAIRLKLREPLAEALATMVAVLIGLTCNLAVQTSADTSGTYLSANWAWGLGIMIGIYIAGGISGGHLNPAISILLCVFRGFPAKKAAIYIAAQITGAILAGLIAFGIYRDAIVSFDPAGLVAANTGKSFYTQPGSFAGPATSIFNEFVATAILSCAVLALGDDSNAPPGAGMHAFIVGLVVVVLTMAFGYNTGACLNPARDFGPRLATAIVGYGSEVFTNSQHWWLWGPWASTIAGALFGGFTYDIAIFVGGESPINYPKRRRRRARMKMQKRWWQRLGDRRKVRELEEGIKREEGAKREVD